MSVITTDPIDVVFAFDTTGSMNSVLDHVRRSVKDTATRLYSQIPNLRLGAITFGCYHDGPARSQPLTSYKSDFERFVETAPRTSGGGKHACYELALQRANEFDWRPNARSRVMVVVGDEPPHECGGPVEMGECWGNQWPAGKRPYCVLVDWTQEVRKLRERGVTIHGIQALNKHYAQPFYDAIARLTGGAYITLDQFDEITTLVIATCLRAVGEVEMLDYANEVQRGGGLTRSVDKLFQALGGKSYVKKVADLPPGLTPVTPGRFQRLNVGGSKVKISDFVRSRGFNFQLGRSFYQFTKPVRVSEKKEVIARERRTGDLYTGQTVRHYLKLPTTGTVTINPKKVADMGFDYFVRSDAENRILEPDTQLLYEVS